MDKKVKQKWVKALRSGRYRQTKYYLMVEDRTGEKSYCCLGVLTKILGGSDAVEAAIKSTFKTCNTCFHSDNAHDDGSGHLDVCFVCAAENENPKTVCLKFNDSGCAPCPFCGSGAVIIEAPSPAGGVRVVYDAFCIDEECGARIEGCATKGAARRLWNNRSSLKPDSGEEKNDD